MIEMEGFEEFGKELENLQKKVSEAEGTHDVTFEQLFNEKFMKEHTKFSSIEKFFETGGFEASSNEDFDKIPVAELDKYVSQNTEFPNWEEMLGKAGDEWAIELMGL